jgi:uridine kinase
VATPRRHRERLRRGRVVGRPALLAELAARLAAGAPSRGRPLLVGVDGADGAGKTTLADELAGLVPGCARASLDDFHHPRAYRHALGRSAATVWARSFDLEALRRELLDPWRRGAGTPYRRSWHDLATDAHVDCPVESVPEDGVLLVDGVFLQRPELVDVWDLVVYVHADDAVRVARMSVRDAVTADPDHPDQRRYLDAQRIYRDRCRPLERADVVVDNTDTTEPVIIRVSPSRG